MLPTTARWGVKSLFPTIVDLAPKSITHFRSLKDLQRGTRIAIDGTLMLMKFHHVTPANGDSNEMCIILTRRLLSSMQQADLLPIVIFDNPNKGGRLPEKSATHAKRRQYRDVNRMRADIEVQRARRFKLLQDMYELWLGLPTDAKQTEVAQYLRQWRQRETDDILLSIAEDRDLVTLTESSNLEETHTPERALADMSEQLDRHAEQLAREVGRGEASEERANTLNTAELSELSSRTSPSNSTITLDGVWSDILGYETSTILQIATSVRTLRRNFEAHRKALRDHARGESRSQRQLTDREGEVWRRLEEGEMDLREAAMMVSTVTREARFEVEAETGSGVGEEAELEEGERSLEGESTTEKIGETAPRFASVDDTVTTERAALEEEDSRTEVIGDVFAAASRQPTAAEEVWEELILDSASEKPMTTPSGLGNESDIVHSRYTKGLRSLALSTITQCAELCMEYGVPVLWTGDADSARAKGRPHEAEALAATLVRENYADCVASEDSDVILYDAPLLRGLTGSAGEGLRLYDAKLARRTMFPPEKAVAFVAAEPSVRRAKKVQAAIEEDTTDEADAAAADIEASTEEDEASEYVEPFDGALSEEHSRAKAVDTADRASWKQMLDFALLCGTDFNATLPGIGVKMAYTFVATFGSIEGMRREAEREIKRVTAVAEADSQAAQQLAERQAALDAVQGKDQGKATKVKKVKTAVTKLSESDKVLRLLVRRAGGHAGLQAPDGLDWSAYIKQLTAARNIFRRPPALGHQMHKVRHLKREHNERADLSAREWQPVTLAEYARTHRPDDDAEKAPITTL